MAGAMTTAGVRPCARSMGVSLAPFRPACASARLPVARVRCAASNSMQDKAVQAVAWSTMAGTFLAAGNASAATEVAQMAASDGRLGSIALLFAPVLGWVLYNIGEPLLNQISETSANNKMKLRGVSVGLGLLAASMAAAPSADAATEIAQVAGDGRFGAIATLFVPVVGWVLFNIGGPLLNQLSESAAKNAPAKGSRSLRGVAAGLGLAAASTLVSQSADAASEVAQVSADSRVGVIAFLFLPVVGWVLFNIGGPALNQLKEASQKNEPQGKQGRRK